MLLRELLSNYSNFFTVEEYLNSTLIKNINKFIILRHDVDKNPSNSLKFAKIQNEMDIKGTYYFRMLPCSWDVDKVLEISNLGHEIGYHYETMDQANGNLNLAWDLFNKNLDQMRKIVDVNTISMHGSPMSKFDNRDLWNKYDYKQLGILGEPYLDIDFNEIFYITDTGRRWDGWKVSVRDKVSGYENWIENGYIYRNTDEIVKAVSLQKFPKKTMFTFHPQRWHNDLKNWTQELMVQKLKNIVKKIIYVKK